MTNVRYTLKGLSLLVFMFALASLAHAQATRTWVSGVGDDVNPCSRTAPCKTFAGAISKTAEGGEIDALDPAGYGTITITKAITIDGGTGAGWGSILAAGNVNGVVVNVTPGNPHGADANVTLRNLSINGASQNPTGAGINGIRGLHMANLHVEHCWIFGFSTNGIDFEPDTALSNLFVTDTTIADAATGLLVKSTAGVVLATVNNSIITHNTTGINGQTNARVTVTNTTIAGSSSVGVSASVSAQINLLNSSASLNPGTGVQSGAGATIRLAGTHVHNNTTGINTNSGSICTTSPVSNFVYGNTIDGTFNCTNSQT